MKSRIELRAEGIIGDVILDIFASAVVVRFSSDSVVENIFTLRNMVLWNVQAVVDVVSFVEGRSYEVEITTCVNTNTDECIVFESSIPAISGQAKALDVNFDDIVGVYGTENGKHLQHCLACLRRSIQEPRETGFYLYKGLESLRQYFVENLGLDERRSWEAFRKAVQVDRGDIDKIKIFADPVRHGCDLYASADDRNAIFVVAWTIVAKYVKFCQNGYEIPG